MKHIRIAALALAVLLSTAVLSPAQAVYCNYFNKHGNHNWKDVFVETSPTCTKNGVMYIECKECGEPGIRVMDKLAHIYGGWHVKRQPTDCELGQRSRSCQVCGDEQTEEVWPTGTVRKGSQDANAIRGLQELLVQGGYLRAATGVYDEETENAVRAVQQEAGFSVNGTAWPQTINYLRSRLGAPAMPAPVDTQTASVPQAQVPAGEYSIPVGEQQPFCTCVDLGTGALATVYCETHQGLVDSCKGMLTFAKSDAMKLEALRMYRVMWEKELELQYQRWSALAKSDEDKGMVLSHRVMFKGYINTQETTWSAVYGADSLIVHQLILDALMQHCANVCMISATFE